VAKYHGKSSHLAVEDSAGTTLRTISTFCDSIEIDRNVGMGDSTTMGSEAKTYLSGLEDATLSLSGKWDDTATTGPDVVLAGNVGNDASVGFEFGPAGNGTGKVRYSGECYVSKYNVSAPLEGIVKFTATLQVTGAVTRGTF
jgi:hypothetical protein